MGQRAIASVLTLKGLKAKEIEMELTSVYGDEALEISAVKKWLTCFLQGRTKLGDDRRSGTTAKSDLTQVIVEVIRECPFLSCKILCRHLRISNERCLRFLHKKLGLKEFHLRWVPDKFTPNGT
jgi:transposase